ncbi:MAG TPA: 2-phospho-L-lactate guanylyltransferase [Frankiaceae bacterium]|jgi:2-phospho-L-lactate guanylyltransferase|nr:2-phospho-L-lactate guanylyltransferase [Frankiaceae bacterium]
MSSPGASRHWVVLLAVKPLAVAKSRLDRPDRSALTLAMAADTASAAASVDAVEAVLVISDDEQARELLSPPAVVVPDSPAAGLNPALIHGAAEASARWPHAGLAVLAADLPALQPAALAEALSLAAGERRAIVADAGGTGTVLLTAVNGVALDPGFGPGSRNRHLSSGAIDLTEALTAVESSAGLRRDVDTSVDLEIAVALGVGPYTAKVLERAESFTWGWQTSRRG